MLRLLTQSYNCQRLLLIAAMVVIHCIFFVALLQVKPKRETVPLALPSVSYLNLEGVHAANKVVKEKLALFDSKPLFLATHWNYNEAPQESGLKASSLFPLYPFVLKLNDEIFDQVLSPLSAKIQPKDLLKPKYWNFFSAFGQEPQGSIGLQKRAGYLKVIDLNKGESIYEQVILAEDVQALSIPTLETTVEFLILIGKQGPIGLPMLVQSSGEQSTDNALKAFLKGDNFLFRSKGYYEVQIGP